MHLIRWELYFAGLLLSLLLRSTSVCAGCIFGLDAQGSVLWHKKILHSIPEEEFLCFCLWRKLSSFPCLSRVAYSSWRKTPRKTIRNKIPWKRSWGEQRNAGVVVFVTGSVSGSPDSTLPFSVRVHVWNNLGSSLALFAFLRRLTFRICVTQKGGRARLLASWLTECE